MSVVFRSVWTRTTRTTYEARSSDGVVGILPGADVVLGNW